MNITLILPLNEGLEEGARSQSSGSRMGFNGRRPPQQHLVDASRTRERSLDSPRGAEDGLVFPRSLLSRRR